MTGASDDEYSTVYVSVNSDNLDGVFQSAEGKLECHSSSSVLHLIITKYLLPANKTLKLQISSNLGPKLEQEARDNKTSLGVLCCWDNHERCFLLIHGRAKVFKHGLTFLRDNLQPLGFYDTFDDVIPVLKKALETGHVKLWNIK